MKEFRARIGRVRMKNGGADVRVLHRSARNGDEDWRGSVLRNARAVADFATDKSPLVAYVLVGVYGDGQSSVGYRYNPETCPIPRSLFPSWLAEVIRQDLITCKETRDVFNEMFEWQDGAS